MKQGMLIMMLLVIPSDLCFTPSTVSGQTRKNAEASTDEDRQVLQALLEEMRQLRLAIQRTQVVSQRIQVTLERIRLQQAHVDSLARSLESVRSRLVEIRSARPRMEDQIRDMEESMNQVDANRRAEMETQIKEGKGRLSILAREEEQIRQREAQLSADLQFAQAKLSDLDNQLDNMMHELEAP